jgi:hypothetical protein
VVFNSLQYGNFINFADFSKKEFVVGYAFCFLTIFFGIKANSIIALLESPIYAFLMFK